MAEQELVAYSDSGSSSQIRGKKQNMFNTNQLVLTRPLTVSPGPTLSYGVISINA